LPVTIFDDVPLKTHQLFIFPLENVTFEFVPVLLQTLSATFQLDSSSFQYATMLSDNAIIFYLNR
jgi:hypothetical protein